MRTKKGEIKVLLIFLLILVLFMLVALAMNIANDIKCGMICKSKGALNHEVISKNLLYYEATCTCIFPYQTESFVLR